MKKKKKERKNLRKVKYLISKTKKIMAVTYCLVQRKTDPRDAQSVKRWYATASSINTLDFDAICEEATSGCSATKGDIELVLNAALSVITRHLAQGEVVVLGEFGRFSTLVENKHPWYDYEAEQKKIPAPVNKADFSPVNNIKATHIRFSPGKALRNMCSSVTYREVEQKP